MLHDEIKKQKQLIARCEKFIALEKLKKRRADTRRKIELGGLVIKSGMDGYNKAVIFGALDYSLKLIQDEPSYQMVFESKGNNLFLTRS
jgi:hypothetical protein